MENNGAEVVELRYYCTIKVHQLMCLELKKFIDRILEILPAIESARPRCTSGIQALCTLKIAMDKAKLLIQHCSESSKLYLICGIARDLKCTKLPLEPSEEEAGKVILGLLRQTIPVSNSVNDLELEVVRLAVLTLKLISPSAVLIEKISIKRLHDKATDEDPKKKIFKWFLYLLKKYGKIIGRYQDDSHM
ncbi:hypothetical protein I3842_15G076600 [Carya illinoinensis]|uniref:Uncharacterized protein n=1 Tax=Carya illinoinensis TaxID=32201 RepID=A0A922AC78_CARIL|nr:hypothetical protein I3842_15G076600 [Carya illinoinensis]